MFELEQDPHPSAVPNGLLFNCSPDDQSLSSLAHNRNLGQEYEEIPSCPSVSRTRPWQLVCNQNTERRPKGSS